ncbi:DUF1801 domain-containing protein [Patescibacteria group bacterium]|nr:DUF1801 domain-containing protein [Patescibacteria group bacterium]
MPTATKKKFEGFSEFEREAMKNRAKELVAEAKAKKNKAAGENLALEAIAALSEPDRSMAKRIHELITENAPDLWPKTWYGMPAYAKNDKVICFFQAAEKFKARYATLGFSDSAKLDEGSMWPTSFGLKELNDDVEKKIVKLVKQAIG